MKMFERSKKLATLSLAFMLLIFVSACDNDDDAPTPITAPTVGATTEITATSFKVNWTAVTAADKYLLDVSLVENFATTVTGFAKKEVTGTSFVVTGLTANTKYYYRMYSKKGTVSSTASTTKDVTTAIPAPTLGDASEIAATSFKVNWTEVAGMDAYLLDVSLVADFSTTVTGFAKKEVTGTSFAVTGLTANTKYYYRMYSKKGTVTSAPSAGKEVTTLP